MSAAYYEDPPSIGMGLITVILILAILLGAGWLFLKYADLPATRHAEEAHALQEWNYQTIQEAFDSGACIPTIYACPTENIEIHYCKLGDGKKSIGLIVGLAVKQIISGFMADTSYWQDRCGSS